MLSVGGRLSDKHSSLSRKNCIYTKIRLKCLTKHMVIHNNNLSKTV